MNGSGVFRQAVLFVATVGYLGVLPYRLTSFKKNKGSGLLGSLAGWALLWVMPSSLFFGLGALVFMGVLSVAASHGAEKELSPDDPRIVIDEVFGVWLACIFLPRALWPMATGLLLFRVFDVWKGPWGKAVSRWPGGFGIVADDALAGLIALGGTLLLWRIF